MEDTVTHQPGRSLRAVITVTVETRADGTYYADHGDFVRHVIPWIEGGLEDRDDIAAVTVVEQEPAATDRATVCICGHTQQQHFEDVCITEITGCDCGDYMEPEAAREVIDRWRSAALQARADRAAVLREAIDVAREEGHRLEEVAGIEPARGARSVAYLLRKLLVKAQPAAASAEPGQADDETRGEAVNLPNLAAALDGLHTLIATSSRDWQTYRVDAWLWAVLCGWDCEQTEHDETCTHGALEETAAMHGWDEATVAKARRYRAAVRALTDTTDQTAAVVDSVPDSGAPGSRP
jgi:hypothetical protein